MIMVLPVSAQSVQDGTPITLDSAATYYRYLNADSGDWYPTNAYLYFATIASGSPASILNGFIFYESSDGFRQNYTYDIEITLGLGASTHTFDTVTAAYTYWASDRPSVASPAISALGTYIKTFSNDRYTTVATQDGTTATVTTTFFCEQTDMKYLVIPFEVRSLDPAQYNITLRSGTGVGYYDISEAIYRNIVTQRIDEIKDEISAGNVIVESGFENIESLIVGSDIPRDTAIDNAVEQQSQLEQEIFDEIQKPIEAVDANGNKVSINIADGDFYNDLDSFLASYDPQEFDPNAANYMYDISNIFMTAMGSVIFLSLGLGVALSFFRGRANA